MIHGGGVIEMCILNNALISMSCCKNTNCFISAHNFFECKPEQPSEIRKQLYDTEQTPL